MRLVGLTVIKNEEQMIELFCRHNLNILDKLYIVDNCSYDKTLEIVESLIDIENFSNIELIKDFPDTCHNQEVAMTKTIKEIVSKDDFDYLFLLDADEFINFYRDEKTFLAELNVIDKSKVYNMKWQTYVPTELLNENENFVKKITHRKQKETSGLCKIVLPRDSINESLLVNPGNHSVIINGEEIYGTSLLSVNLAHIPIRTRANTITKFVLNSHTLSTKKNRKEGETFHWDTYASFIRAKNYLIDLEDLIKIAYNYSCRKIEKSNNIIEDPIKTFDNVDIKYRDRNNPLFYYDKYIGALIENNKEK